MVFGVIIKCILPIFLLFGSTSPLFEFPLLEDPNSEKPLKLQLTDLFEARSQLIINADPQTIRPFYLLTGKVSQYAFGHEVNRMEYLTKWAKLRGVKYTHAESSIRIIRATEKGDTAKVSLVHSLKLSYQYIDKDPTPQIFGVGTRNGMTLKKVNGKWLVYSEWYSDPMDENPNMIPSSATAISYSTENSAVDTVKGFAKKYNRERAVAYADKYAGGAWGAGNNHKYNNKYKDYTHYGGDCTNFASQVIGDREEGGGLPMTSSWFARKHEASVAWVQTDSFKNFLLWSGYGRLVARGSFPDLLKASSRYPNGPMSEMKPGDLIAYEMKGDVDHFCVMVGRDSHGYPLVNSHSGDRYHVPWDIGWDKFTKFWLIHIRD